MGQMGVPITKTEISNGMLDDKGDRTRYNERMVRGRKIEQHFDRVFHDVRTR